MAVCEGRLRVSKAVPHTLESLATHLNQTITNITGFLEIFFAGICAGKAGEQIRDITINLFNHWCRESLIVSSQQAAESLSLQLKRASSLHDIKKVVREIGFVGNQANLVVAAINALPEDKCYDVATITEALWPAYTNTITKFCAQTAHVLLAGALLYRIGEDQQAFPHLLSSEEIYTLQPATELLFRARLYMADLFPNIYQCGEFDWWWITPIDRAALTTAEQNWLSRMDQEFEHTIQDLLRLLNGYFFGSVDVDVWRNVYQNYLPADERQRLGGFYTPDLLVDLILDLAEFQSGSYGLCQLSFIDPASGSGAFISAALTRLLKHLELDLPCHKELTEHQWTESQQAETILNIVVKNLHAVDLHPFAAFLTTVNTFFLLLPFYVKVREKDPDFSLKLQIFSSDLLEKYDRDLLTADLFAKLNSRVQLTQDSFHRYQEMLQNRFDRVFGNPPWGGVLKGDLAPVYDASKKARFSREYPAAAQGKYDVYGLFIERILQILKPNGRFGLLTQGSFLDKEWALGLRDLLASKLRLCHIVDLNPFGQLYFNAMNTPCITIVDTLDENIDPETECITIVSTPPNNFKGLSREERCQYIDRTIRKAVNSVSNGNRSATIEFAQAARVPISRLRKSVKDGWDLDADIVINEVPKGWFRIVDILEPLQGVTVGGKGCLDLFLMEKAQAKEFKFPVELIQPVIKGIEIVRWRLPELNRVILYPYTFIKDMIQPAFTINLAKIKDQKLKAALKRSGILDALDFDKQIDRQEQQIVLAMGVNHATVIELLEHRQSLGLLINSSVANYLVKHYDQLEGRVFEKRNIRQYNKQWYEYHRPRDSEVMLLKGKIITPRLFRRGAVRFTFDNQGIIPQDSCICLSPTSKTEKIYQSFHKQVSQVLAKTVSEKEVFYYCLAFLNSEFAETQLIAGQRPTPKGFYAITEKHLCKVAIPAPYNRETTSAIIDHVTKLVVSKDKQQISRLEKSLAILVNTCLSGSG
ncbi:MAG: hypothetical protein AB1489_02935 [Acidobacteriota bacterium]